MSRRLLPCSPDALRSLGGAALLAALLGCSSPEVSSDTPPVSEQIMAAPRAEWCAEPRREIYASLPRVEVASDWFEVYELPHDVFAIYEPYQFEEALSYLIVGDERALLFDTGLGIGRLRDVVEELTLLPVDVLNSHTHFDHTGGNAEFDRVYALDTPQATLHAEGASNADARGAVAPEALCRDLPAGVDADSYSIRPYEVHHFVKSGEKIGLGGRALEVIATPGHTPDALMLFDQANGLLFTGDSFYEGPIYLFAPGTDWNDYRRSISRVARLVPELEQLLPGHNTPLSDPGLLLDLASFVESIERGEVEPQARDGYLEYDFSFRGFSILRSQ